MNVVDLDPIASQRTPGRVAWGIAVLCLLAQVASVQQVGKPTEAKNKPVRNKPGVSISERHAIATRIATSTAEHAFRVYDRCAIAAKALETANREFLANPTAATLARARTAWISARRDYGRSEALRYSGGPIDDSRVGLEPLINSWPVDEANIDAVAGHPSSGLINDPERCPLINGTVLCALNERGGEKNVTVGWHAIEFLLWGQDLFDDGPGRRSHEDYIVGKGHHAERRRAYLSATSELLVSHLEQVRDAWAPKRDNYRARYASLLPEKKVEAMLTGLTVLTAFEMAGERLAVAYETQDQEEEHSCFSDTTQQDLVADQLGVVAVYRGQRGGGRGPGLHALAVAVEPELASEIDRQLDLVLAALRAIPTPFDRAIRGRDDAPGRTRVRLAIEALEAQAEMFGQLGLELGFDVPIQPRGA